VNERENLPPFPVRPKERAIHDAGVKQRLAALNAMPRQDRMAALVEDGMEKKAALTMISGAGADAALGNYVFEKVREEHEAKEIAKAGLAGDDEPLVPTDFSHLVANAAAKVAQWGRILREQREEDIYDKPDLMEEGLLRTSHVADIVARQKDLRAAMEEEEEDDDEEGSREGSEGLLALEGGGEGAEEDTEEEEEDGLTEEERGALCVWQRMIKKKKTMQEIAAHLCGMLSSEASAVLHMMDEPEQRYHIYHLLPPGFRRGVLFRMEPEVREEFSKELAEVEAKLEHDVAENENEAQEMHMKAEDERVEYEAAKQALSEMPSGTEEYNEMARGLQDQLEALEETELEAADFQKAAVSQRQQLVPPDLRAATREKVQMLGYDIAMEVYDSDSSEEAEEAEEGAVGLEIAETRDGEEEEKEDEDEDEEEEEEEEEDSDEEEDGADVYGLQPGSIGLVPQRDAPLAKYRLKLMPFDESNADEIEIDPKW